MTTAQARREWAKVLKSAERGAPVEVTRNGQSVAADRGILAVAARRRVGNGAAPVIRLFQAPPGWGLPNISPACMKLETWLRIAEIPYEVAPPDLSRAPKGKIPYIELDGVLMGDSTLVVEHLATRGLDMDRGLGHAERAVSLAFRRMMKEHLYWVLIYDRWVDDNNFAIFEPLFLQLYLRELPLEQQKTVIASVRANNKAQCLAQGMGRHTPDEVHRFGMTDLQALSDFLDDKPFLMGKAPTTADAAVYAHVANTLEGRLVSPVKAFGRGLPNLLAYCERMRARFFPDLREDVVA